MATERKLDISAISFDDMFGDGLESVNESVEDTAEEAAEDQLDDAEPEVESEPELKSEQAEIDNEVDEDLPENDEEISDSLISEISNTLGFNVEGEYEETVEGITNFVRDMSQNIAESQLQQLFEQYPEVQQHLDFIMSGGQSNQYMQQYNRQIDFEALEIDPKDTNTQRGVFGQYLKAKGHDEEFISDMLDTLEENGKLFAKSQQAKTELVKAQEEYRQQMVETQKQQFEQQRQQEQQFWNELAKTIEEKSDFAGVTIPDSKKNKFFEYISQPVNKQGQTQRDVDYGKASMDVKLAIDYLMFNGFKLNDIIDKKARTKSAQNLRDRIISNEERVKSARKATRSKKFDVDNLDMGALLG